MRYYFDTCIWRDYFENRSDKFRPLGEWALSLIKKIILEDSLILFSDLVIEELRIAYSNEEIKGILSIVPEKSLIKVKSCQRQLGEAKINSKNLKIPVKDALHRILARDNHAILITRDKHFLEFENEQEIFKPEDLI